MDHAMVSQKSEASFYFEIPTGKSVGLFIVTILEPTDLPVGVGIYRMIPK